MRREQIKDILLGRKGMIEFRRIAASAATWIDKFDPEFRKSGGRMFLDNNELVNCWLDMVQADEGNRETIKLFDALVTYLQKENVP